jgi:hypothetical protein
MNRTQPDQDRAGRAVLGEQPRHAQLPGALFARFLAQHEMRVRGKGQRRIDLAQDRDDALAPALHREQPDRFRQPGPQHDGHDKVRRAAM